jgi:hypothetical protein
MVQTKREHLVLQSKEQKSSKSWPRCFQKKRFLLRVFKDFVVYLSFEFRFRRLNEMEREAISSNSHRKIYAMPR